jgi:hypothetical protein
MSMTIPAQKSTIVLYHDGCNVCQSISATMTAAFYAPHQGFESVDLSIAKDRGAEASALGIKRLPSLVINGRVLRLEDHSPLDHYV